LETLTIPLPDDEEYDPKAKSKTQKKKKVVAEAMPPPSSEMGRQNLYILPEDHSHIFSNSMDLSFSADAGFVAPSSQVDTYGIDDIMFGNTGIPADGTDIADELARELGEGWVVDQTIRYVSQLEQEGDLC
jgi:meiotic recombination protein REC8